MQFPKATEKKISDISSGNKSSKSSYISDFTQYFFGKIKATVFRQIYVDICGKKNNNWQKSKKKKQEKNNSCNILVAKVV